MEQQKEYMIVMTSDGRFHRAEKMEQAEVGMEVHFRIAAEQKVLYRWTQILQSNHTKVAVIAIVFLMTLFPIFSWYGSNQSYAYMNIDINPSVELELNDQMQVIEIVPQNKEAEQIVSSMKNWEKKDASEVTFDMIQQSQEMGYVNKDNQVLIGISYLKADFDQNYSEEIETFLLERSDAISIATFLVPDELRKKAHEQKGSVNEMVAERIKKQPVEVEKDSVPITVEDDDKEIIQSFYKEESSEEDQETPDTSIIPVTPTRPEGNPTPSDRSQTSKQADTPVVGKESAPGQQEKDKNGKEVRQEKNKGVEKKKSESPQHGKQKSDLPEKSKDQHKEKQKPGPKSKDNGQRQKDSGKKPGPSKGENEHRKERSDHGKEKSSKRKSENGDEKPAKTNKKHKQNKHKKDEHKHE